MQRRQLLGVCSTVALGATGGCSTLTDETTLRAETREESGRTHVVFLDDETLFQLTVLPRPESRAYGQLISLNTWQERHLRLDSFRFVLEVSGADKDITTVLETPEGSGYQNLRFYRARDDAHASVLEMEETGGMGEGSVPLNVVLVSQSDDPLDVDLAVEIDAELSDGSLFGTKYRASEHVVIELPTF